MKKFLSAVLAAIMVFSAFSALAEGRHTDFFADRDHADVDFSDLPDRLADADEAVGLMESVSLMAEDAANADRVKDGYLAAHDAYIAAMDDYELTYLRSALDYTDGELEEAYFDAAADYDVIIDAYSLMVGDILRSPCAEAIYDYIPDYDREYYLGYTAYTEEDFRQSAEDTALSNGYWDIAPGDYEALGELYLEIVESKKQLARGAGFDSFADYAYYYDFGRDYSPEDAARFCEAVKEYIAPLSGEIEDYYNTLDGGFYWKNLSGEEILDLIEPCLADMSDELYEAEQYMRAHGFYDIERRPKKNNEGFTTYFSTYRAPFLFNQPYGNAQDVTDTIHEIGHYNDYYHSDEGWDNSSKGMDVSEVHSQGLELLFTHYYDDIFGPDAEAARAMIVLNLLAAIIEGCVYDELQQFAFEQDDLTVEKINQKLYELCLDYGIIGEDDAAENVYYLWTGVSHNYETPFYYISYAASAAAAFKFYLSAQDDFYGAVDEYLKFMAQPTGAGFHESCDAAGIGDPLSPYYVKKLADSIGSAVLGKEAHRLPFEDVSPDAWYYTAVEYAYETGFFKGTGANTFSPDQNMTRAMLSRVFYTPEDIDEPSPFADVSPDAWYFDAVMQAYEDGVMTGYPNGSFGPNDTLTREQFAVVVYRILDMYVFDDMPDDADGSVLEGFNDADEISPYALSAMRVLVDAGIINGTGEGTLSPKDAVTRAQAAQMIYNIFGK